MQCHKNDLSTGRICCWLFGHFGHLGVRLISKASYIIIIIYSCTFIYLFIFLIFCLKMAFCIIILKLKNRNVNRYILIMQSFSMQQKTKFIIKVSLRRDWKRNMENCLHLFIFYIQIFLFVCALPSWLTCNKQQKHLAPIYFFCCKSTETNK